jgi:DNA-directed RNA polymerase III subunit RPC7
MPPTPSRLSLAQETALPQAGPPSAGEASIVQQYLAVRDRIHEGPFYTLLGDGMKNGLKRKANETAPTEASLFDPFVDNQTYSSKYLKKRRKLPNLALRPYAVEFFPAELHETIGATGNRGANAKKRTLVVDTKVREDTLKKKLEAFSRIIEEAEVRDEDEDDEELEEEAEGEEKEDAGEDDDKWSAVSSDSEESGDDYNAEQYFDNGEDDDAEDDTYDNAYDL